jgi:hypothetical protein
MAPTQLEGSYDTPTTVWRLQDLRDGGGLGFTVELILPYTQTAFIHTIITRVKTGLLYWHFQSHHVWLGDHHGLFWDAADLINLICYLVIRSRGVFSDFPYPEYIVDMLLKLVGKMVDRHGNAHPQIHDTVDERDELLWGLIPGTWIEVSGTTCCWYWAHSPSQRIGQHLHLRRLSTLRTRPRHASAPAHKPQTFCLSRKPRSFTLPLTASPPQDTAGGATKRRTGGRADLVRYVLRSSTEGAHAISVL